MAFLCRNLPTPEIQSRKIRGKAQNNAAISPQNTAIKRSEVANFHE